MTRIATPSAIIGGTGVGSYPDPTRSVSVETPYGAVQLEAAVGEHEGLWFLPRHGPGYHNAAYEVNYRANIQALAAVGVRRAVATFAVGSVNEAVPPGGIVALDQFIDFTSNREATYFEGGVSRGSPWWLDLTEPFCSALRASLIAAAPEHDVELVPAGTYICFNGPRLETAAEIRMSRILGADVVGMTLVPEIVLANELAIHYAGIAVSINWAAGVQGAVKVDGAAQAAMRDRILPLMLDVLATSDTDACACERRHVV